jgi:hypothetical protein
VEEKARARRKVWRILLDGFQVQSSEIGILLRWIWRNGLLSAHIVLLKMAL